MQRQVGASALLLCLLAQDDEWMGSLVATKCEEQEGRDENGLTWVEMAWEMGWGSFGWVGLGEYDTNGWYVICKWAIRYMHVRAI